MTHVEWCPECRAQTARPEGTAGECLLCRLGFGPARPPINEGMGAALTDSQDGEERFREWFALCRYDTEYRCIAEDAFMAGWDAKRKATP